MEDVEGLGGVELPVLHVRTEQVIVWTGIPLSERERRGRARERGFKRERGGIVIVYSRLAYHRETDKEFNKETD